ncbi:1,4-dihydroxy-2-naphthoate polyprenyltransferase [Halobacteriovorax sp. GB3]|uniref:1,4-dihydroxy-2-naphthoate polyprenyltransferase n=1 Tax=Halobacteriovorax sp. GB3 TaxID=2719615 RepID=UPI00236122AF|nr:1,4-dihydroxy-2-naphthoate polyprenyltransferase [Halobacteriovorax sp. GB3]MDD0852945.1 1,4-dihydroxy-2-naphthoate polyprenyltransferase [Halobacteriovorax sp. GB3]
MSKTQAWLLASRPKTLFAAASPVILAAAAAYYDNKTLPALIFFLTIICAVLLQIASNLINDYYDGIRGLDDEDRLGPTRVTSSNLLSSNEVKKGCLFVMTLALLVGIYLMIQGGLPIVVIGLSSLFFAWAYTGGPFPLSYYGLGEVFAFLFFGPIALWGAGYLFGSTNHELLLTLGLGPGFISATIMGINNLRDLYSDKKKGKKTIATFLGEKKARLFTVGLAWVSSFVPFMVYARLQKNSVLIATLLFYAFILVWNHILTKPIDKKLNDCLANTGKYLFFFCLVLSAGLVF